MGHPTPLWLCASALLILLAAMGIFNVLIEWFWIPQPHIGWVPLGHLTIFLGWFSVFAMGVIYELSRTLKRWQRRQPPR